MAGNTLAHLKKKTLFFWCSKLILGSRDTELMVNQTFGEFLVIPKYVFVCLLPKKLLMQIF